MATTNHPPLPRSGKTDWRLDYHAFRENCKTWVGAHGLKDKNDELVEFVEGGEMYRDRTWVCASSTSESYFGGNDSLAKEVGHEMGHLGEDTRWGVRGQVALSLRFLLDGEETVLLLSAGQTPYSLRRRLTERLDELDSSQRRWRLVKPLREWLGRPWEDGSAHLTDCELAPVIRDEGAPARLGEWRVCERRLNLLEPAFDGEAEFITPY